MSKLLLVEGNEMNWDMLSRRLRRRGHEVLIAVNSEEIVNLAQSEYPDLMIMDMGWPILTSWEATRQPKATPENGPIPFLALTAHAMPDDRDKALEAGCDDFDTKPIEFSRPLMKIELLLGNEGQL